METTGWDVEQIGRVLGSEVHSVKPEVWRVEMSHRQVARRLRLELAPQHQAVRLYGGHPGNRGGSALSQVDLYRVGQVQIDETAGQVRFVTRAPNPAELIVWKVGTFQLSAGHCSATDDEMPPPVPAVPAAPVPDPSGGADDDDPESVEDRVNLVGRLARPHYSERTGRPFFTAGLAEQPEGEVEPIWHRLKAFGGVARHANELRRGQLVRLSGKPTQEVYDKDGEPHLVTTILLSYIEPG